jgi:A/G-specific adenine glycosylase
MPTSGSPAAVRAALIGWYDRVARDLPWRRTRDPYAIWVSEIMLQQTRVETVLRYYDAFLARFPSTEVLAAASEDEVMAAWSGLGYYRRARNLHSGVREVVARHGGQVPAEPEARRALPGIGRYTAGAIGSIAFEREEPIVDGNVARVLCRVHGIDTPPARRDTERRLWHEAERLVRGARPSALNQSLMELGATVCTKHDPRCAACPLQRHCRARAEGTAQELPRAQPKRPPRPTALVALLATHGRGRELELWLARGEGTLFGGLWNLPMADGHGRRAAAALLTRSGLRGRLAPRAHARVEHVLTHRKLDVQLWHVTLPPSRSPAPSHAHAPSHAPAPSHALALAPVRLSRLGTLGISQLTRKALAASGLDQQRGPRSRSA